MNALLIYPHWPDTYWSFRHALWFQRKRAAYPPLGLLTVAAMLPPHWNLRLVDSNVRPVSDADLRWANVAMISGMMVHEAEVIEILSLCRSAGVRTVVGGPIASSIDLRHHADFIVIGEAEELMPQLVEDLEGTRTCGLYRASKLPSLDATRQPALQLMKARHYSTMALQYSRGCPFHCEFCDIIEIYGRFPRTRSIGQVIGELEQLYENSWSGPVFFVDDNFIGNKRNVKQMLPVISEWNQRHRRRFRFITERASICPMTTNC